MISKRLETIANYVEKRDRIVDVGCDHGLLAIHLYKNSLCSLVIASDKNQNAIKNAIKNIENSNLTDKISTHISDGLNDIDIEKFGINTLIIAGMGTKTILKILDNPKCNFIDKLILQSNNEYYELRKNIIKRGFIIEDETIILENKKYYLTINFKKGKKRYNSFNYQWGIVKKENKEYYNYLLNKYQKIYSKIPFKQIVIKIRIKNLIMNLNKIIKSC